MPVPAWPPFIESPLAAFFAHKWGHLSYPFRLPLSSVYGFRRNPDPATRPGQPVTWHSGIDIPLPRGTPVIAVWPGYISRVDRGGTWNGNAVHLRAGPYSFSYLHLDTIQATVGEQVPQGRVLGTVGNTGHSFGYHLHFQVTIAGKTVNPLILYPGDLFVRR